MGTRIEIYDINSAACEDQLADLNEVDDAADEDLVSKVNCLDAFVASYVPYFDFAFVVGTCHHRCLFDWSKCWYHALMTYECPLDTDVEELWIYFKDVYFCFVTAR